ncbi:hypothetical protein L0F81_20870, partial [Streptomyces tricolor]
MRTAGRYRAGRAESNDFPAGGRGIARPPAVAQVSAAGRGQVLGVFLEGADADVSVVEGVD